jgi:hypothetical protein
MAKTLVSDILTPANWADYGVARTSELSALWQSGIVAPVTDMALPSGGGTVNMPFFQDLSGDMELLSDSSPLTVGNITAAADVAAVIGRGRAFSVNDLAAVLSGADPAKAVLDLIAGYWARQQEKELIQILTGAFAAASMSGNVSDITAGGTEDTRAINDSTFIDATQKLGDAKDMVSAVVMHSAAEAYLAKKKSLTYELDPNTSERITTYMGKRVIVDDGVPVSSGNYTTYIFGPGAVGYAEDTIGDSDIETDRDILAGDTVATFRRRFILHPRGIKWQGTPAGKFPSRAELAVGTNWVRVYENKQIRMVRFVHKVA